MVCRPIIVNFIINNEDIFINYTFRIIYSNDYKTLSTILISSL